MATHRTSATSRSIAPCRRILGRLRSIVRVISSKRKQIRFAEQVLKISPVLQVPGGAQLAAVEGPRDAARRQLQTTRVDMGSMTQAEAPPSVHEALAAPGQPLDWATRSYMEPRFGHDFSRVRVHSGPVAQQSARDVSAHAYTVGNDIVFGSGRFVTGTSDGRRLLAHELTHVVQQSGNGPSAGVLQREHDGSADKIKTKLKRTKALESKSATGRLNSYADLLGAFQDLAVAAIDEHGRTLDSVRFGGDLSRGHRLLLVHIRDAFKAQDRGRQQRWRVQHGRNSRRNFRPVSKRREVSACEARCLPLCWMSSPSSASITFTSRPDKE